MEPLESRLNLSVSFSAHINFQPKASAVPSGYVADTGTPVAKRVNGLNYGWSTDVSASAVDRKVPGAGIYSTYIPMNSRLAWEIILPNGTYSVSLSAGDATRVGGVYQLDVNGKQFLTGTPTRRQHILKAAHNVTVTNNRLILTSEKSATAANIDAIDVTSIATTSSLQSSTNVIQAHGGDIVYHNGVYYWYGENKNAPTTTQRKIGQPRANVVGVSVYESLDLHTWDYRGLALPVGTGDLSPSGVVERPKVLYNAHTHQWVMWMHIDNATYTDSRVGVAVSDSPIGPFTYRGSFKPLGRMSRDMTVFQDDDGVAYLVFTTDNNDSLRIAQMNSSYTALTGKNVKPFSGQGQREAPQLFKRDGRYYLITSGATWFKPNAAMYAVSSKVLGKYKPMGNPISGTGASTTFSSQGAFAFEDVATGNWYLLADQWNTKNLGASKYVFLPIKFSGSKITLGSPTKWRLGVFA